MPTRKVSHVVENLARIEQINQELAKLDKNEKKMHKALDKTGQNTEVDSLKLQNQYLVARLELYNETVKIEKDLLRSGARSPSKERVEDILETAKRLDLSALLRKQRSGLSKPTAWCLTKCEVCITCTECISSHKCGVQSSPIGLSAGNQK